MDNTPTADRPIVNIDAILDDPDHSDTNPRRGSFEARFGLIGRALGTEQIGINVTEVPPLSKAWPRHYHYINDEIFVILSGRGVLHHGERDHPLAPGDVVYIKAGTGIPFQIENDREDAPLRYLALSSMQSADLFHYPDSGKYGIMAGGVPLRSVPMPGLDKFTRFIPGDAKAGYWDGELSEE